MEIQGLEGVFQPVKINGDANGWRKNMEKPGCRYW